MALVVIVRHGERLDEVREQRQLWKDLQRNGTYNWNDPPLTETGMDQSRSAGVLLKQHLEAEGIDDLAQVQFAPVGARAAAECITLLHLPNPFG